MTVQEAFAELQALDLKNPGAWPRWAHIGAAVMAFIVLVGFGVWTFLKPEYETLGVEEQTEQTLRAEF